MVSDCQDEDFEEEEEEQTSNSQRQSASGSHTTTTQTKQAKSKTPVLDNFSTDLTQQALDNKLDPVVGREREIQRVVEMQVAERRTTPSSLVSLVWARVPS